MYILVTGGAGYIGSHAVLELLENNYKVIVIDNFSNSSIKSLERVESITGKKPIIIDGDIRDLHTLDNIFSEHTITAIMHFAGLKSVAESIRNPIEYYENNIYGTLQLLRAMDKYKVYRIIFSSSATVYGDPIKLPLKESMVAGNPINPYGMSKLMIENILKDWNKAHKESNVTLLRYFNPVGAHLTGLIGEDPKDIPNNLMPLICKVAIGEINELTIYGNDYVTPDGTGIRDFIHVSDLVKGHVEILKKCTHSGIHIYNLGTGKGISVLELINTFQKVNNVNIRYKVADRRDGDIASCYADSSKIKKDFDWETQLDVERMCQDAWRWQKLNPHGYDD